MLRLSAFSSEAPKESDAADSACGAEGLDEIAQARREYFVSLRLAIALPVMALAPLFLLLRGAPRAWEALAFALLLAPLAGVAVLRRSGRFALAQAIGVGSMVLLGVTLSFGQGALTAGAAACFILAPVEAALGGSSAFAMGAAAVSLAGLALASLAAPSGLGGTTEPASLFSDAAIVAVASIYAAALAVGGARIAESRESRVRRGEALRRDWADAAGDLILRLDAGGRVLEVVSDPDNAFSGGAAALLGRGLFERVLVGDRPKFVHAIAEAARLDAPSRIEFRFRAGVENDAAGPPRFAWVELRAQKSRAAAGQVTAALRDLTPAIEAREALEAARRAGDSADDSKSRFLANVSHELRTPLNAIIGFSEMLGHPDLAPKDPERRREYANIIHASGEHLLGLVNTILDVSKMETGHFEIAPEPFGLVWLLDFCCDLMKLKLEAKGVELIRDTPPRLPDIVADKRACRQIVLNLLANAVKFTPEGGRIVVSARVEGDVVKISVADNGVGVAAEDLPNLGDPFFQARAAYDRPYEGAGLGLSIVRGLVGLHGGALAFESAPGQGARVTVSLPLDCRRAVQTAARIECAPPRAAEPEILRHQHQGKKIA